MSTENTAHFTAGPGKQVLEEDRDGNDNDHVWVPSGWHNPDGVIRLPFGYAGSIEIDELGRARVYYYGERCW